MPDDHSLKDFSQLRFDDTTKVVKQCPSPAESVKEIFFTENEAQTQTI